MRAALAVILLTIVTQAGAAEYECDITKKLDAENQYTAAHLEKWQFSVRVKDYGDKAILSDALFPPLLGESPVMIMKLLL